MLAKRQTGRKPWKKKQKIVLNENYPFPILKIKRQIL